MRNITIIPGQSLKGSIPIPGDKSISHRGVMLGAIASGVTTLENFLSGDDCLHTVQALRLLGVNIEQQGNSVRIEGLGSKGLIEPNQTLDMGNSGTAMRLMAGLLSGYPVKTTLDGDEYLRRRPMHRIIDPLRQMGANINGRDNQYPPLEIRGGNLKGIEYHSPIASAQVKSAVLLAGLHAEGETVVIEPEKSRDHTERMLQWFGADLTVDGLQVSLRSGRQLKGQHMTVPGDISSAAFFIVGALLTQNSKVILEDVGINSTRTGILEVLEDMGANISLESKAFNPIKEDDPMPDTKSQILRYAHLPGEPIADIRVRSSRLTGTTVGGEIIPRLIDEIPILCVAAALAEGVTVIKDAAELRVKETDRIHAMRIMLESWGVRVEELPDGLKIYGQSKITVPDLDCLKFGDHRVSMATAIAALASSSQRVNLLNDAHVDTSFPQFFQLLGQLTGPEVIDIIVA